MTEEVLLVQLDELIVNKLPSYIEDVNARYNDGIILEPFTSTTVTEGMHSLPYIGLSIEETEYSEKDRIIENEAFTVAMEFRLAGDKGNWRLVSRYTEAIKQFVAEQEYFCRIVKKKDNKIFITINL